MKKESKRQLYTEKQIEEATEIVRKRTLEVIRILGNRANLIAYMIKPDSVAIGACYAYNEDVIENLFYENITKREGLEFDGNAGYTLLDLAKMIKDEEI